ncbi:MAG: dihydrofolate reductase [Patescibacteria group bacterium]|nr:dihydrofolate reductase [Patescibacteria group bacterium]MDE1966015.1 dihydrofolate reductase [Patescibacteria group bacterium]
MITLIAAIGEGTRALGRHGDLLYKIPEDLARFRARTKGHPVVMGRKTWESLPDRARPLPKRANIVITRDASYGAPGAVVVTSIEDAFRKAKDAEGADEIFVIGGGEIYALALPYADRLDLTLVDDDTEGDAYFPEYEREFTKEISREEHETPEGLKYAWVNFERT